MGDGQDRLVIAVAPIMSKRSDPQAEASAEPDVLHNDEIVGLVTLADVLYLELDDAHVMNKHLETYRYGPYS